MKHDKIIVPDNSSVVTPSTLPDRSKLSRLYLAPKEDGRFLTEGTETAPQSPIHIQPSTGTSFSNQIRLGLLLTIPIVVTYLAAIFIYQGRSSPDPLFPLQQFFVSAAWLISCVVSMRILRTRLDGYGISLGILLPIYIFYLFPLLSLTYDLFPTDYLGVVLTISLWIVANCLIVPYMFWSFNRAASSTASKVLGIVLPVIVLIICAVAF